MGYEITCPNGDSFHAEELAVAYDLADALQMRGRTEFQISCSKDSFPVSIENVRARRQAKDMWRRVYGPDFYAREETFELEQLAALRVPRQTLRSYP